MAGMVVSAIVQETVGRVTSYLFSKHGGDDETASRWHDIERLEMARAELEFVLERSARMPITDVSLLRRRKLLERAFKDSGDALHRCSKQQAIDTAEMEKPMTQSSFPKRIAQVARSSISSYFTVFRKDGLGCGLDVQRYEWLAECASRFLRDAESGCSPQRYMFSNTLVRLLLQGKTLQYSNKVQGSILHRLHIWPNCVEGRGVEATLEFRYEDHKMPARSFALGMMLRLSESTDIVGTAIKSLQSFTSSMRHMAEAIIEELTRLPQQDISCSGVSALCFSIQDLCDKDTQFWRPDALCCKPYGCAGCKTKSDISCRFPEQVILVHVECCVLASECSKLHKHSTGAGRDVVGDWPLLKLGVGFAPHFFLECMQGMTAFEITKQKAGPVSYTLDEMDMMVRSKAIDHCIRQPDLTDYYKMGWYSGHGAAYFVVRKSGSEAASAPQSNKSSKIQRGAKRRRSK